MSILIDKIFHKYTFTTDKYEKAVQAVKKLDNQSSLSTVSSGEETNKKRIIKKNTKYEFDYNLSKRWGHSPSSSAQSSSDGEVIPTVPKITPKAANSIKRHNNQMTPQIMWNHSTHSISWLWQSIDWKEILFHRYFR